MEDRIVTEIAPLPKPVTFKDTTKAILRVAAYARVSTDHEDQQSSLAAQAEYYTKKISEHPGWQFVQVYVDEGISGLRTERRDGFNRMIEDCLVGAVDLVLTKSISRFARNTVDSVSTIRKLKERGIAVYFEKENIYTMDSKGEFLLTIMSSLAQEESRSISENVTWGQRKRLADGKTSLAYSRFLGYDKGKEKYEMVVNEEQAITVRRIFFMFLQGYTAHSISKILTDEGVPTPCGCDVWYARTIQSILQNEKYKGDALLQKEFTVDFLTRKLKKNEGELPQYYVKEDHEPIISPWLFDYVQKRLKERGDVPGRYSGVTVLSSKLECGVCGSMYTPRPWHSTSYNNLVWQCRNRTKKGPKCPMTGMDGYFDDENQRIAVRIGMGEVQTVCAAIHEIAHSLLHGRDDVGEKYQLIELFEEPALYSNGRVDREKLPEGLYAYDLRGSDDDPGLPVTIQEHVVVNHAATVITATPIDLTDEGYLPLGEDGLNFLGGEQTVKGFLHEQFPEKAKISRNTEEVQAESISYAVCAYFGIETGENSFGYIATWSKDKKLPELKASLETINRTASGLITDIDRNFKALMKERGLDKEPESLAAEPAQEITVQEPEPVSAPDNGCVPDPAISVESMNAYGYTDANMLPLTKGRALELMERDVTVYMLHTDNTEAMAFDADEIRSFDGIFGVEASEWETVKDRFAPRDYEKAFLDNPADSFAIYQLRDSDDTARLHFMNYEYLEKKGLSAQKENYAAVYAGNLDHRGDTQDRLNELYETFNIRRPEDFRGHSLSVSDIVALKQNGVVSCHYVDSWGFKELPGFLKPENYLKNAEMAMEDDYGMIDGIINNGPRKTVAELEEQSKTGTPISLLELAQAVQRENEEKRREQQPVRREKSGEKPSILAKLKASSVADTKSVKSAPKRSAEREL